jgi:hypothetical protein
MTFKRLIDSEPEFPSRRAIQLRPDAVLALKRHG